jgi:predicted dienelactone hydrolase
MMSTSTVRILRAGAFGLLLIAAAQPAAAVGFQQASIADPTGRTIELAIWYPSEAPATPQPLDLWRQTVAPNGAVAGTALPLIVISHGTGGGASTHYDTALALAGSGFVVVALTHPGDNWRDRHDSFTSRGLIERPRQVSAVVDYMLTRWPDRDRLDPARIGMFGHSAGGFTALVVAGGVPQLERAAVYCREYTDDWGCERARARRASLTPGDEEPAIWKADPRVKAVVIAAPALGYVFTPGSVSNVAVPVQLWEAEDDRIVPNSTNAEIVNAALPTPPETHLVPAAGHFDFLAPCNFAIAVEAPTICGETPGFDRAAFHQEFNRDVAAFFTARLMAH